MMVLDSSALVAILLGEHDGDVLAGAIYGADRVCIAAPTLLETLLVLSGRKVERAHEQLDALLQLCEAEIVAFASEHVDLARAAFQSFGKGNHHPAQLNFGDCMAYALAKSLDAPLLFKGGDFALTDIVPAL